MFNFLKSNHNKQKSKTTLNKYTENSKSTDYQNSLRVKSFSKSDNSNISADTEDKTCDVLENSSPVIAETTDFGVMKDDNFDNLNGIQFEHWCAKVLEKNNFKKIIVTQATGDQGVDILAEKDDIRYAFQCKCYSSDVNNSSVQQIFSGKNLYKCHVGVVITNQHFTKSAKELADSLGVILWDREKLLTMQKRLAKDSDENSLYSENNINLNDPLLKEAIKIVSETGMASTTLLQRKLKLGYILATTIMDQLEFMNIIGPFDGAKPRKVLLTKDQLTDLYNL